MFICDYFNNRKKAKEEEKLRRDLVLAMAKYTPHPKDLETLLEFIVKTKPTPNLKTKVVARYPLFSSIKILLMVRDSAKDILLKKRTWDNSKIKNVVGNYGSSPVNVWADIWLEKHDDSELISLALSLVKEINTVLAENKIDPTDIYRSLFELNPDRSLDKFVNGYVTISSELFACLKAIYTDSLA